MRSLASRIARRIGGLVAARWGPRGSNALREAKTELPRIQWDVIFDVGAHIGQSAREFRRFFPNSTIHCFEPVQEAHLALLKFAAGHRNIHTHQLALGAKSGTGTVFVREDPTMSGLSAGYHAEESLPGEGIVGTESAAIDTVDAVCSRSGIEHIALLKVDTEGGDLDVLKGANDMLSIQAIDAVLVEAGASPMNRHHVPLERFMSHLEPLGYSLFGFYDQTPEWQRSLPNLRRVNALFASNRITGAA